jgi:tripeptide aminopeptidase
MDRKNNKEFSDIDSILKRLLIDNFLRYVRIDTQSDENSKTYPSTLKQFDLADLLVKELKDLGINDAQVDAYCYVTATIPSNTSKQCPVIGLFAHMDTSPEVSGANVNPQIIESYKGGDIILNEQTNIIIRVSENKHLNKCIGHTLITTDGTTLLGSDDKAGVAAIITMIAYLQEHPEIEHGAIRIAFTPDEEVGKGVDYFDIKRFNADFAYTIDGGFTGELNYETFSADTAVIDITGRDMHPGSAKDLMVNSIRVMASIIDRLPKDMAPETTEHYEPYIHPNSIEGSVYKSKVKMLLRDFSSDGLQRQREMLENIIADVKKEFPDALIVLTIEESYRNMCDEICKHPYITERLFRAAQKAGANPFWKPIRGGTDGSRLTSMGLPTPNIFTGACNAHSLTEWLSIDALVKTIKTLINIVTGV